MERQQPDEPTYATHEEAIAALAPVLRLIQRLPVDGGQELSNAVAS